MAPELNTATPETEAPKKSPKPRAKKAKAAKKAAKPKAARASANGHRKVTPGLTAADRRRKVLGAMRSLGATGYQSAVGADRIAKAAKLTEFDVYGALYHANPLGAGGYVKQDTHEDVRGLVYYLTAKGQKSNPDDKE